MSVAGDQAAGDQHNGTNENTLDDVNFNEEFKRRLIENNFDLMNGKTIQVTTDREQIPQFFVPIDNLEGMKQAVSQDMEQ